MAGPAEMNIVSGVGGEKRTRRHRISAKLRWRDGEQVLAGGWQGWDDAGLWKSSPLTNGRCRGYGAWGGQGPHSVIWGTRGSRGRDGPQQVEQERTTRTQALQRLQATGLISRYRTAATAGRLNPIHTALGVDRSMQKALRLLSRVDDSSVLGPGGRSGSLEKIGLKAVDGCRPACRTV